MHPEDDWNVHVSKKDYDQMMVERDKYRAPFICDVPAVDHPEWTQGGDAHDFEASTEYADPSEWLEDGI